MKIGNLSELDGWFEFKTEMVKAFPQFFDMLFAKHSDLKPKEIKICALLFLDCNTKDIAGKLGMEPPSVDKARSRLRKKFNLSEDGNLNSYLQKLK